MRLNKKVFVMVGIFLIMVGGITFWFQANNKKKVAVEHVRVSVGINDIKLVVTAVGTVQPRNRLEVIPPITGRIEKILVKEGDEVKEGQILAYMSSLERAALLDSAKSYGRERVKYWEEVYKPTPVIAPITGRVIVRNIEPGQTVNSNTPIIVLSDKLYVLAQIDEIDIGKIKIGQEVKVKLDAFKQNEIKGKVGSISYESKVVSNVTVYEVWIDLEDIPDFFRSGMNGELEIILVNKEGVLSLPVSAIKYEGEEAFVNLSVSDEKTLKTKIVTGITDRKNMEILSGLSSKDVVLVESKATNINSPNRQQAGLFSMPMGGGRGAAR